MSKPYGTQDFLKQLQNAGVVAGDSVMVQSI